ncbi:MAG: heme-copper oxidase subunit III [Dehalococcoidia bacterium]
MAVAAASHGEHGHDSTAINRAGLWLFFGSEAVLFGLLGTSRFYLEGIQASELNQVLGLGITTILVTSSVTAYIGETAMEHDRRGIFAVFISLTILLGLLFGAGVAYEWSIAHFHKEEVFGTLFFAMTGLHASHVLSGLVLLVLVLIHGLKGRYNSKSMWPVAAVVMWWHFVDIVWVFYYPTLYLVQGVQ